MRTSTWALILLAIVGFIGWIVSTNLGWTSLAAAAAHRPSAIVATLLGLVFLIGFLGLVWRLYYLDPERFAALFGPPSGLRVTAVPGLYGRLWQFRSERHFEETPPRLLIDSRADRDDATREVTTFMEEVQARIVRHPSPSGRVVRQLAFGLAMSTFIPFVWLWRARRERA